MSARLVALGLLLLAITAAAALAGGVTVTGGSAAQQQLARKLLDELLPTKILSVMFRPSTHPPFRGQEMDIAGSDQSVRNWWEESFFGAAFVRGSKTLKLPEPRLVAYSWGAFTPVHGPGPPGPRPTKGALASYLNNLRLAAAKAHAQLLHLRAFRLGPVGVAVTLKVNDPAAFLKHRSAGVLAAFNALQTDIYARYLGLLNANGTRVWEVANAGPSSSIYIEPDLQGCNPIPMSGIPGQKRIPPCPAK